MLRTAMRTTDLLVTGLISPAAIAAIGIANLYTQFPLFLGLGLGSGSMALTSQETGRGSTISRDKAISTACTLALALGFPFALFGFFFSTEAMRLVGSPPDVLRAGSLYLSIVLVTAPARQVTLVVARALQGTGNTLTPMYIRGASNIVNITGTITLGLGVGIAPQLGIFGVGIATASANVLGASLALSILVSDRTKITLVRPDDPEIAKQVVRIATPRAVQGFSRTAVEIPLNAILLTFGVNVNAGYQVGRRVFQQMSAPVARSFNVVTSIIVGQAVGERNPDQAVFVGKATALFGICIAIIMMVGLYFGALPLARIFSEDAPTVSVATFFIKAFAVGLPFTMLFRVFAGALEGGSETRIPFVIDFSGLILFMLAVPYFGGILLNYGMIMVGLGIVAYSLWRATFVWLWFDRGSWYNRAGAMMDARENVSSN
jgi:putative MATE family efflux protein